MASLSGRADDVIGELWRQFEQLVSDKDFGGLAKGRLEHLKDELRFIRIFVECVKRWSDLEDVLHLGFLLGQIEATLAETGDEIIHLPLLERPLKHSFNLNFWKRSPLDRTLCKLHDMVIGLCNNLYGLLWEVNKAYKSSWSFEFRFDYDRWKEFGKFINNYLEASNQLQFRVKDESDISLKKQLEVLNCYLDSAKGFIDFLLESSSKDMKIQVMIEVGRVAISAALQLCHGWSYIYHKKIDRFTSPKFPLEKDFAHYLHTLQGELKSMVISVITFPRDDVENVQRLFASVGIVLNMVAKEAATYRRAFTHTLVTDLNMLTEIWYVKLEMFVREQLNTCDILQKEQIDAFRKGLTDLNYEEWLKSLKITIKQANQVLAVMEEISTHLRHYFDDQEMTITNETVRNLLLLVLLFKADRLVRSFLYHSDQTLMVLDKNQTETLHKGLELLIMFLKDKPTKRFEHIEQVACGVCSLFNSIPTSKTGEEACKNMGPLVSELLEKIVPIMVELKVFPKLGFIDTVLEKLRELLKTDVATSLKHQIEEILRELELLAPFLEGAPEQNIEFQGLKDLRARIVDVAYEAEHYIDSVMLEDSDEWHNLIRLYHLREDIRLVKENSNNQSSGFESY